MKQEECPDCEGDAYMKRFPNFTETVCKDCGKVLGKKLIVEEEEAHEALEEDEKVME